MLTGAALGCGQDTQPVTGPESPPVLDAVATTALVFYQVSAGNVMTCGVTTDQRAYCWGIFTGDGTNIQRLTPVAVAPTLRFRYISSGLFSSCGVTTDFVAYCWGGNDFGALGDGTTEHRWAPVRVAGGHRFRQVETAGYHTCGLSYPDNRAYCWGENFDGQLGDGTRTNRLTPVAVARGLTFRQVTAGFRHTCGVTTADFLFCWGLNKYGQIGDSLTLYRRLKPSLVSPARRFHQVDAGANHTCAVTTGKKAFCWGDGREGQIGNGKQYLSYWPRAVAGGLAFTRVTAGGAHSCGESISKLAYCWGSNASYAVGSPGFRILTPAPVDGGYAFAQVSAGGSHTCAKTGAGVAYCWGDNSYGQLGNGTIEGGPPGPVAGAM
jgi:alpha-tubulin suppressor-like RCC1 family protein